MYKMLALGLFMAGFFCWPVVAAEGEVASILVQLLAGHGIWGAVVLAIIGLLIKYLSPHLQAWLREKNMIVLYDAIKFGVTFIDETVVQPLKKQVAENGGDKITVEQFADIKRQAKDKIGQILVEQGAGWMKDACAHLIDSAIEHFLNQHKAVKAVIAPLPDLEP